MDLSERHIAEVKSVLDDYKNTGNPDLLKQLRRWVFEYMDYEGDDPVIKDLKATFHC